MRTIKNGLTCVTVILAFTFLGYASREGIEENVTTPPVRTSERVAIKHRLVLLVVPSLDTARLGDARVALGMLTLDQFSSKAALKPAQSGDARALMAVVLTGLETTPEGSDGRGKGFWEWSRHRLPTLFERAEQTGLATGLVTDGRVTDAAVAVCCAHTVKANDERRLGLQLLPITPLFNRAMGDGIDVLLGGGLSDMLTLDSGTDPLARDPALALAERHYAYSTSESGMLNQSTRATRLVGLFGGRPNLWSMTSAALEVLERRPENYILLIYASRVAADRSMDEVSRVDQVLSKLAATVAHIDPGLLHTTIAVLGTPQRVRNPPRIEAALLPSSANMFMQDGLRNLSQKYYGSFLRPAGAVSDHRAPALEPSLYVYALGRAADSLPDSLDAAGVYTWLCRAAGL